MPNIIPTQIFTGYALLAAGAAAPSQGVFIPLASISGLSDVEGNATTGDGRKVAFGLAKTICLAIEALPANARPNRMAVVRGTPSGVSTVVIRQAYTLTFDLDVNASDVATEAP